MYLLHPVAQLSWTNFTVHASTAIGIAALGALYAWRAHRGPSHSDRFPVRFEKASRNAQYGANSTVTAIEQSAGEREYASSETGPTTPERELASQEAGPTLGQRASFFGALIILFLTLNGPLHDLSDYFLFSAHMVQHLILTLIVPPLLITGTPGWMLRPLLRFKPTAAIARKVTKVAWCFAVFNIVLAFWHLPPMYNLALANHGVHILQHIMFIAASVLMWWPLTSPLPELPRAPYPAQMLYCFLMVIPMSVISIYVAMADTLLYPAYSVAPRIMGITPMEDQQYGGLIMWIPGGVFFYAVMTVVFFKWSGRGGEDSQESAQVGWKPA